MSLFRICKVILPLPATLARTRQECAGDRQFFKTWGAVSQTNRRAVAGVLGCRSPYSSLHALEVGDELNIFLIYRESCAKNQSRALERHV